MLNNGVRWARFVGKRPVALAILVVVVLGALAIPLKDLHLAFPTDSTASTDTTQRKASDLMSEAFGPGREGPLLAVVDGRDIADDDARGTAFQDVADLGGRPGRRRQRAGGRHQRRARRGRQRSPPRPPVPRPDHPVLGPGRHRAPRTCSRTCATARPASRPQTGTDIGITGQTAIQTDVSERLSNALPIYLAIVIGLAFLLLMIVFRSILVPLTATLGFLFSVLATLGATVLIFQEGTFGLMQGQPIVSFMPIFLIGVVFGLAMDYQVFLVSRMREAHVHGMSTREAVVDGFRNSARVVTAAATIMTAVFAAFMLQDDAIAKSMGFALAAAVVFDAFIVRMVLIPALLYLLGEKAWWLPAWLDRILPNVDVEGEKLQRAHLIGPPARGRTWPSSTTRSRSGSRRHFLPHPGGRAGSSRTARPSGRSRRSWSPSRPRPDAFGSGRSRVISSEVTSRVPPSTSISSYQPSTADFSVAPCGGSWRKSIRSGSSKTIRSVNAGATPTPRTFEAAHLPAPVLAVGADALHERRQLAHEGRDR